MPSSQLNLSSNSKTIIQLRSNLSSVGWFNPCVFCPFARFSSTYGCLFYKEVFKTHVVFLRSLVKIILLLVGGWHWYMWPMEHSSMQFSVIAILSEKLLCYSCWYLCTSLSLGSIFCQPRSGVLQPIGIWSKCDKI